MRANNRPPFLDIIRSTHWILWTGLLFQSVSILLPISVFFLTLNRLLFLKFPITYTLRRQQWLIHTSRVLMALGVFYTLAVLGWHIAVRYYSEDSIEPTETRCLTFSCLVKPVWSMCADAKAGLGFANLCAGTLLLVEVWRLGRVVGLKPIVRGGSPLMLANEERGEGQRAHRRANTIALMAVGTELFFNFLPQIIAVILGRVSMFFRGAEITEGAITVDTRRVYHRLHRSLQHIPALTRLASILTSLCAAAGTAEQQSQPPGQSQGTATTVCCVCDCHHFVAEEDRYTGCSDWSQFAGRSEQ